MLGKIIDGTLTYPPNRIILNGMQIFNPTDDQLIQVGYKPITETPMPEDPAPEGQHYEAKYTDDGDTIMQSWVLIDDEPMEPAEKTIEERVTTLEQNVTGISTAIERGADIMMADALESVIRYARNKLMAEIAEMDDKTEGIACKGLFPVYEQNHSYSVGDVRLHPTTGTPKECMTAYDGSVQPDWTIDTATLWKPWHSRKKEYALPWEAPTGAHDMYKAGEYMIWTDGTVKKCIQDTNFSPEEYPQAWEDA